MLTHISKVFHTEYTDKKKKKYSGELFCMFGDMKRGQIEKEKVEEERMCQRR